MEQQSYFQHSTRITLAHRMKSHNKQADRKSSSVDKIFADCWTDIEWALRWVNGVLRDCSRCAMAKFNDQWHDRHSVPLMDSYSIRCCPLERSTSNKSLFNKREQKIARKLKNRTDKVVAMKYWRRGNKVVCTFEILSPGEMSPAHAMKCQPDLH